jgi:hypothetical protein
MFQLAAALSAMIVTATAAAQPKPSFADLLAKANKQLAEGHRFAPPGDNFIETAEAMLRRLDEATPKQQAELINMLDIQKQEVTKESKRHEPVPPAAPSSVDTLPSQGPARLLAYGETAQLRGDISAARRFYLAAAHMGSAAAARNLARLYDPDYLSGTLGGVEPDADKAREWYAKAADLGDDAAAKRLKTLARR